MPQYVVNFTLLLKINLTWIFLCLFFHLKINISWSYLFVINKRKDVYKKKLTIESDQDKYFKYNFSYTQSSPSNRNNIWNFGHCTSFSYKLVSKSHTAPTKLKFHPATPTTPPSTQTQRRVATSAITICILRVTSPARRNDPREKTSGSESINPI